MSREVFSLFKTCLDLFLRIGSACNLPTKVVRVASLLHLKYAMWQKYYLVRKTPSLFSHFITSFCAPCLFCLFFFGSLVSTYPRSFSLSKEKVREGEKHERQRERRMKIKSKSVACPPSTTLPLTTEHEQDVLLGIFNFSFSASRPLNPPATCPLHVRTSSLENKK